jgi:hypothetical protein
MIDTNSPFGGCFKNIIIIASRKQILQINATLDKCLNNNIWYCLDRCMKVDALKG